MLNALYKILFVGSFLALFLATTEAFCQNRLPDVILTIDETDIRLGVLLERISEKTRLSFSYNPKKIPVQKRTSYRAIDASLQSVLNDLCREFGLTFSFVESQIVLKPDKESSKAAGANYTINGTVKDADTGEALIGATVYIRELMTGTITNPFGFYSITIPQGAYTVTCSFIGYAEVTRNVELGESFRNDVMLVQRAPMLEEIVVSSIPSVAEEIITGSVDIRPANVEEQPEIFGELDVVKSLESIPGVKFHSDGSTFYYVRGGNRDQNVIFIDDAPIYNPSHLLGVFSTIIPDAVNDITLYKGDMPASLGGRLSSVLDVRTKKGNDQRFSAWGNVGLISAKAGIEGPFKKNVSSYLLSARVSSLKWIAKRVDANIQRFDFHDLTGKLNFRFNGNNGMFFSFYSGGDNYFGNNVGIAWANNAATLQWNHLFNDRLFLNTTIAGGGYEYFLHTNLRRDTKWNSRIANFTVKTDFSCFIRPENELTFGLGLNGYGFNPGNMLTGSGNATSWPLLSVRNSAELVLYGNHQVKINEKLGLNYGLRLTSWSNIGEAFEFVFEGAGRPVDTLFFAAGESYKQFVNAEPRLTLSYFFSAHTSLKGGFARNVQNIHLISNSISPFTSLDVWLPSSFNIEPQRANQVSLGYYYDHPLRTFSLSAEVFHKKMFNQIDYDAHARILLNPLLESELKSGEARAYGIELFARKDEGRLRGWVGYTWSRAKQKFPEINGGREYNAFYDRPHQIALLCTYDLTRRWQLSANWNYSTGSAYSAPVGFYSFNGEEVPVYGQRNNARLPDYHRLDLSSTWQLNRNPENRFNHHLSVSIFNFYGRKNPLFVNFNKTEAGDGSLKIPGDMTNVRRITSQFYLFGFTPSVSYSFKWL